MLPLPDDVSFLVPNARSHFSPRIRSYAKNTARENQPTTTTTTTTAFPYRLSRTRLRLRDSPLRQRLSLIFVKCQSLFDSTACNVSVIGATNQAVPSSDIISSCYAHVHQYSIYIYIFFNNDKLRKARYTLYVSLVSSKDYENDLQGREKRKRGSWKVWAETLTRRLGGEENPPGWQASHEEYWTGARVSRHGTLRSRGKTRRAEYREKRARR